MLYYPLKVTRLPGFATFVQKRLQPMSRSIWKGPFVDQSLLKKIPATVEKAQPKTWSRRSYILPQFVGQTLIVHNGNSFIPVLVTEQMIGHKLGEFARSRKLTAHKKKERNK